MRVENTGGYYPDKENLFTNKYNVTVHTGGENLLHQYGSEVLQMHTKIILPIISDFQGIPTDWIYDYEQTKLVKEMTTPSTTFAALEDKASGNMIGFTYAVPDTAKLFAPYREEELQSLGISYDEYQQRQYRTAHMGSTIIDPEHRSKGGWTKMIDALENKLHASGRYDELTRSVRQENNYAEKIRNRYKGRIITDIPDQPSPFGPQTYFRITL